MQLLRGSKVYAPTFDKKLPLMLERSYGKANFPTKVRRTHLMGALGGLARPVACCSCTFHG